MRLNLVVVLSFVATLAPAAFAQIEMGKTSPVTSPDPAAYGAAVKEGYDRVRAATAPFKQLSAAVAAGYAPTVEVCLADSAHGAMGYHHINRAYVDKTLEVERPEILLYERLADGTYALDGVEYIAVASGLGGAVGGYTGPGAPWLRNYRGGGTLFVFRLFSPNASTQFHGGAGR